MSLEHFWDLDQRSPAWFDIRRGVLSASNAAKLVTPGGKPSTQWRGEMGRLIAEKLELQDPEDTFTSEWMQQGIDMEGEAIRAFEFITGIEAYPCGFVRNGNVGFSPDALMLEMAGETLDDTLFCPLQVKCPKPSTHIEWVLEGGLPTKHWPQVYFELVVSEAPWAYFMSYCRNRNPLIFCVHRHIDTMPDPKGAPIVHCYNPDRVPLMENVIEEFSKTYIETYEKVTGGDL